MDISKHLKDAYKLLLHRKILFLPLLSKILIIFLLLTIFFTSTHAGLLFRDLVYHYKAFDEQKIAELDYLRDTGSEIYIEKLEEYNAKDEVNSAYSLEFMQYLSDNGYDYRGFISLFSMKSFFVIMFAILFIVLLNFWFDSASYVMTAKAIKGEDFSELLSYTNNFFVRYLGLLVVLAGVFLSPLLVVIILVMLLASINSVFVLLIFPLLLAYLALVIYLALKVIFSMPSLLFDKCGPITAVEKSIRMTKGRLVDVFFLGLVLFAIKILSDMGVNNPMSESFSMIILSSSSLNLFGGVLLFCFLAVLGVVVSVYTTAFLLYAYIGFDQPLAGQLAYELNGEVRSGSEVKKPAPSKRRGSPRKKRK